MRFSIIWIMPIATLIAKCADSATTKAKSLDHFNNDSLPKPASTEERVNIVNSVPILKATPTEASISAVKQAMAHVNAGATNVHSDEEADMIMQKLWSEFIAQNQHPANLPTLDRLEDDIRAYFEPEFIAFVHQDHKRSEEWMHWKNLKASKKEALAHDAFALTPAMIHPTTETAKVLSNEEAMSKIQGLWMEFQQQLQLSKLPVLAGHSLLVKGTYESEFLSFVSETPTRQSQYNEWLNWRITTFGRNGPDFTLAMVYTATEEEADKIMQKLWSEFIAQSPFPADLPTLDRLEDDIREYFEPEFIAFVRQDHKRSEEWMQWLNHKASKKEALAHDALAFTPAMIHPTTEPAKVRSDEEANLIISLLWKEFIQNNEMVDVVPPLSIHYLKPREQTKIRSAFLKFVRDDEVRTNLYEAWLASNFGDPSTRSALQGSTRPKSLAAKKTALTKKPKADTGGAKKTALTKKSKADTGGAKKLP